MKEDVTQPVGGRGPVWRFRGPWWGTTYTCFTQQRIQIIWLRSQSVSSVKIIKKSTLTLHKIKQKPSALWKAVYRITPLKNLVLSVFLSGVLELIFNPVLFYSLSIIQLGCKSVMSLVLFSSICQLKCLLWSPSTRPRRTGFWSVQMLFQPRPPPYVSRGVASFNAPPTHFFISNL